MAFKAPKSTTTEPGVITLAGDLGGTATSPSALKVNGVSYPSGPGTNTVPVITSSNTVTYQQIADAQVSSTAAIAVSKLAAGTSAQILINNATPTPTWATVGGDVSISATGSVTVSKINGSSVPAGGSLTTGNVLQVTGGATLGYAAVNLAGGANFVTGNLPVSNVAPGTSAQVLMSNATPATTWTTIGGDVSLSATGSVTINQIAGSSPVKITTAATLEWSKTVSNPTLTQETATSGNGQQMVHQAQSSTASTSTGGNLILASGSGTSADGYVSIEVGGTQALTVTGVGGLQANLLGTGVIHSDSSGNLTSSLIVNADVSSSAAIAVSKLSNGTAGQFLVENSGATAPAWTTISGDVSASVSTVGQLSVVSLTGSSSNVSFPSGSAVGNNEIITFNVTSAGSGKVKTVDTSGADSAALTITTGTTTTSGNSGALNLTTGAAAGTVGTVNVQTGGTTQISASPTTITLGGTGNTSTVLRVGTTTNLTLTSAVLQWAQGIATPAINQAAATGAGTSFTIQAQNAGGSNNTGGNLVLTSGSKTGVGFDGYVYIEAGGTAEAFVNSSLPNFSDGGLGIGTTPGTDPTISRGTGVPSSTQPNGSIFLRTDGTASTGIYTRQSGSWSAVGGSGTITLTGDVTGSGSSSIATTVAAISGSTPIVITPVELQWKNTTTAPLIDQAAPASASGSGTAATTLNMTAQAGGATTGSSTTAGAGGALNLTGGAGGSGSGGTNAVGGAGANVVVTGGAGGASSGTAVNSNGGNVTINTGAAGTGGSGTAGVGGTIFGQVAGTQFLRMGKGGANANHYSIWLGDSTGAASNSQDWALSCQAAGSLLINGPSGNIQMAIAGGNTIFQVNSTGTVTTGSVQQTVHTNTSSSTYTIDTTAGGSPSTDYIILNSNTLTTVLAHGGGAVTFSLTNGSASVTASAGVDLTAGQAIVFGSDTVSYVINTTISNSTSVTLTVVYQGTTASGISAKTFSYYGGNYILPAPTAGRLLTIKDTTGFTETNPINLLPNASEKLDTASMLSSNITGTVTVTSANAVITGSSTTFTTQVVAGQAITFSSASGTYYTVAFVTSNTSLTLTANYVGSTTSGVTAKVNTFVYNTTFGALRLTSNGTDWFII